MKGIDSKVVALTTYVIVLERMCLDMSRPPPTVLSPGVFNSQSSWVRRLLPKHAGC